MESIFGIQKRQIGLKMQKNQIKIKIGTWFLKIEGDIVHLVCSFQILASRNVLEISLKFFSNFDWQKCCGNFTKVLYQILRPWLFASSFASAVSRHELHKVAQRAQKHLREVTSRQQKRGKVCKSFTSWCVHSGLWAGQARWQGKVIWDMGTWNIGTLEHFLE